MIPAREYNSVAEMKAGAAKARQALIPQKAAVNVWSTRVGRENEYLKTELAKAEKRIESMTKEMDEMRHQVSEYQRAAIEYMREMEALRGNFVGNSSVGTMSVKDICLEVLENFPDVSLNEVRSAKRSKALVQARFACIYAVFTLRRDLSYPRIGEFFNRDHTSIMNAVRVEKSRRAAEIEAQEGAA